MRLGMRALMALAITAPEQLAAHGGGLDANGCHHDRKRGGYHCHRAPSSQTQEPPRRAPQSLFGSSDVYFPNCAAARAAGAAPLRRGDPGYRAALDRDSDGVACE